jgi:hypothetical protein
MTILVVQGGKFEVPKKCADCSSPFSVHDMLGELLSLSRPDRPCVFCGTSIKVTSGTWKHFHKPDVEKNTWSMDAAFEYEPHWEWLERSPHGGLDVRAHVSCARARMKFANFENSSRQPVPETVPPGGMPVEMGLETCHQCGQTPTVEDLAVVAARNYAGGPGPCVYCGKTIRLEKLSITHFWWDGEHCEKWQWGDWRWEKFLHWSGWTSDEKSKYIALNFNGHYDCTLKAMPYHVWLEDQPRCNCK